MPRKPRPQAAPLPETTLAGLISNYRHSGNRRTLAALVELQRRRRADTEAAGWRTALPFWFKGELHAGYEYRLVDGRLEFRKVGEYDQDTGSTRS